MAKYRGKSILAPFCPCGVMNEPSLKKMYKGCSIYEYYDSDNMKKYVMLDSDFNVRFGTNEVMEMKNKTNIEIKYDLYLVRKIDESN